MPTPRAQAFTDRGRLNDTNGPAHGAYDFTLTLFNAATGGAVIRSSNGISGLVVTSGLFTVTPDFGPQFCGLDRWLEIAVRTNGGSTFSRLSFTYHFLPNAHRCRSLRK